MGRLDGRQAENNVERPDGFVLGGFEEDGRTVVEKTYKSGKAADKPDFFMGGCGPVVPTGPKRKLRSSWLANGNDAAAVEEHPKPHVEHVPKPLKKWTPVAKNKLPLRAKSHDGTMTTESSGVRKGRKPLKPEDDHNNNSKEEEEKEEEPKPEVPPTEEPTHAPTDPKPAWEPPTLNVRKPPQDTAHMAGTEDTKKTATTTTTATAGGKCSLCESKDAEIAALKAELEKVKAEKGELAATVKKSRGSIEVNKELKQEIATLKEQLEKAEKLTAKADPAHHQARIKLENKLNTLKMIMDGKVDKNSLEDLKEHVDMLNMILNQDLKKEGMKNVWA